MKTFLIYVVALPLLVRSQSYKEDMLAAMQCMSAMKNYTMRIDYKLFLDGNTRKAFQQKFTLVKRNEKGLYYKQSDGMEFISNNRFEVSVNERQQQITARRKTDNGQHGVENPLPEMKAGLDSLFMLYEDVKVVAHTKDRARYQLRLKADSPLESIVVCIDRQKKRLVKVQYRYKKPSSIKELKNTKHRTMLEISYEQLMTGNVTDSFNEQKYLAFNQGKIKPAAKYAGYTLNIIN